jgi:hypothetical protein
MMDFLRENKMLALILIAAVLFVGGYFAFFSGSGSSALLSSSSGTSPTSQVSTELLATISDLKGITLNNKLFTDDAFVSLVDFHVDIPLQPVGRSNPFAPLIGGVRADAQVGIPGR